ncbi:MAG TPA: M20/M25/M40 family metallo-hydrolase [Gemmatimonadales bacterium]|nr:M20/M25/M40 family metallo-hydrolase [Gemmatimonadales bacterium]
MRRRVFTTGRRAALALLAGASFTAPLAAQNLPPIDAARIAETESVLGPLVESYGPSGAEGPVRATVQRMLPSWAHAETDTAGNLWVRVGKGDPLVVFVAHMDEIGFSVSAIGDDGSLEVKPIGGFIHSLFESRPALIHTPGGDVPAVFEPRSALLPGADSAARASLTHQPTALVVDVGTENRAATERLGVKVGQTITMPKEYVRLAGTRATGRSFDDRVGCTALILALRRLDPSRLKHQVIFIWSVREEIGLEGAAAAAASLGGHVARVHGIDTFVSADSPLEIKTFADALVGDGPVSRAVDNSAVTPPPLVDTLVALARTRGIPLQVGTTNGGNDGSAFAAWGVPDVAIGWPLRYSHSPAEVVDLRDVAGLADIVQAVAEGW